VSALRILIVEDDEGSRDALRTLLEILGHEVEEAENGERAIAVAFSRHPDLIFMDVGLPGLNGYEVAKRIRGQRGGDFYMVAFTGHPRPRGSGDGFDAHLLKPVSLEQIEELLEAVSAEKAGAAREAMRAQPARPVLVVEDDPVLREALVATLEQDGYPVVTAAHGRAALDLLRGGVEPCLIVLDLMMSVMSGWDFRRAQLSEPALARIPVLVVSAHHEAKALAGSAGVSGVLQKPIDFDELLGFVAAACGR
jgi:CheY-like chemotaxis protein